MSLIGVRLAYSRFPAAVKQEIGGTECRGRGYLPLHRQASRGQIAGCPGRAEDAAIAGKPGVLCTLSVMVVVVRVVPSVVMMAGKRHCGHQSNEENHQQKCFHGRNYSWTCSAQLSKFLRIEPAKNSKEQHSPSNCLSGRLHSAIRRLGGRAQRPA